LLFVLSLSREMIDLPVNLVNAIPSVLMFVEDTADLEAIRDERREFKHRLNDASVTYFLMAFPYGRMVEYAVGDGENVVLIRDVMNLPEFRQRLANILGIPGRVFCEVHEIRRDLVEEDGIIERDDAIVTFTFSRWNNHPLRQSDCLYIGDVEDPNDHVINRHGVCHCCGSLR